MSKKEKNPIYRVGDDVIVRFDTDGTENVGEITDKYTEKYKGSDLPGVVYEIRLTDGREVHTTKFEKPQATRVNILREIGAEDRGEGIRKRRRKSSKRKSMRKRSTRRRK